MFPGSPRPAGRDDLVRAEEAKICWGLKVVMAAERNQRTVYASAGWEIDLARRELRSRGAPVPLGSRAFEIVAELVQADGELLSKDELTRTGLARRARGRGRASRPYGRHSQGSGPDRDFLSNTAGGAAIACLAHGTSASGDLRSMRPRPTRCSPPRS